MLQNAGLTSENYHDDVVPSGLSLNHQDFKHDGEQNEKNENLKMKTNFDQVASRNHEK